MPEPPPNWKLPEIDLSKRYDVYYWEPRDRMVIYRNARFKSYVTLFGSESRGGIFVELEQANGHTVFLARHGLVQFCPHGTEITAEFLRGKDSDGHYSGTCTLYRNGSQFPDLTQLERTAAVLSRSDYNWTAAFQIFPPRPELKRAAAEDSRGPFRRRTPIPFRTSHVSESPYVVSYNYENR